jgi:predicted outer membrane protein
MSIQRLHAFEKTSIQARHTIKRLEAVIESQRTTEFEKTVARNLLDMLKDVRKSIPKEFQDVDLKDKE